MPKGSVKFKPPAEYAILGALMTKPMHGYEILRFFNMMFYSIWHIGASQLYALLKRLERSGLLQSDIETQIDRPSRRIFSITQEGKKSFLEWLYSPTERVRDMRVEFIAKLFFIERLSIKDGKKLLEDQSQILNNMKSEILEKEREEKDPHHKLVLGFKRIMIEA